MRRFNQLNLCSLPRRRGGRRGLPLARALTAGCVLSGIATLTAEAQQVAEEENAAPTLKDRALAEYAIWRTPGAVDVRPSEDYEDNFADDVGDGLFFAPGVWVNRLDIHEPRIVLRGFGLANRQERSTAPVLRDGAPLTNVHGTTNTQEINLQAIDAVNVWRGGAGDYRYVGGNLGGAVNFVSKTGRSTAPGIVGRLDGGVSIEGAPAGVVHVETAGAPSGAFDYYASLSGAYETGFRDQNGVRSAVLNANFGYAFSPKFRTRFFLEALDSDIELAGGLDPSLALADPSLAAEPIGLGPLFPGGPFIEVASSAEDDEFARDILSARIANLTEFNLFWHEFELGGHYARRAVDSPQIDFVGVLDETGGEWGVRLAAEREATFLGLLSRYKFGGEYSSGTQSSDRFENLEGERGDQFADTEQKSTNLNAFLEGAIEPFRNFIVEAGAKFIIVDRELTDNVSGDLDDERFTGVAAKAGVIYSISEALQVFVNAARTYEPPSFSELIADDPSNFNELSEQDAFTVEFGFRGKLRDWIGWDIAYFRTDIENEIINLDDPETNGLGGALANVAQSSHDGVEIGLDVDLMKMMGARSARSLTLRNAYAYNDFRITDADGLSDLTGNRLAGVPQHVYRGELRFAEGDDWFTALNVEVAAGDYFIDQANLVSAPTYAALGFSAGWRVTEQLELFASGENLLNTDFAAGLTPVLDQQDLTARVFTPANGTYLYAGARYSF